MKMPNATQPITTLDNAEMCQVNGKTDKTPKRLRIRSGAGTVAYWKAKLFRNSYRDRDGRTIEIPEFYVRLRHEGVSKKVRLRSSEKEKAAEEALGLSERLLRDGWIAVTRGQSRLPSSPTIEEFCEAYRTAAASMDTPPRPISIDQYLRHLRQICALAGVTRLRELTPEAAEVARDRYRAQARADRRSEAAIQNSLGIIIRNASACFSKGARAVLARQGWTVENPFVGIARSQKIEPVAALNRDVVDRIWNDLPKLRDGDPTADDPKIAQFTKSYGKKHEGRKARWLPIDFRQPHPDAYCAILLAHGLGLRANEIDKARWSWIKFDAKGACLLEVREEADFRPKGGTMRLIPIPKELHEELVKARVDLSSPYILGGQASKSVEKNGWGYRCRETLRVVNSWLRERGVEADEVRGNPLHRLRKQFGSAVATTHGLFAAQKLLGHSSPSVTSKYYAAHTDLPELTHVRIVG